uniref:Uncharacterized protein n=1 Tax=Erpetoichthys calabaricus TaxID=27687 RepID=A0A8C4T2M7_ERPCA
PDTSVTDDFLNEITCFICQETLSDPVSILCGHSFCLKCLNDYWDQSHECSCPECRRTFTTRPELHRNTVLNELVKKIKKPRLNGNLKVELCVKHQKRLEIFCKNEETCICMMCALTEHEGHKKQNRVKSICVITTLMTLLCRAVITRIKSTKAIEDILETQPTKCTVNDVNHITPKTPTKCLASACRKPLKSFSSHHNVLWCLVNSVPVCPLRPQCPHLQSDDSPQVLCREGLTGTRFYWEVECNGIWIDIGVAYKGLSRKGRDWGYGLRYNDKSWCLHYSQYYSPYHYSEYHNNKKMEINTPYSSRIGVYLDWPAGSLSFYSVSHTMTLLHRFSTTFTEPLYPGFSLNVALSLDILCPSQGVIISE